jgi:hypothetical protein
MYPRPPVLPPFPQGQNPNRHLIPPGGMVVPLPVSRPAPMSELVAMKKEEEEEESTDMEQEQEQDMRSNGGTETESDRELEDLEQLEEIIPEEDEDPEVAIIDLSAEEPTTDTDVSTPPDESDLGTETEAEAEDTITHGQMASAPGVRIGATPRKRQLDLDDVEVPRRERTGSPPKRLKVHGDDTDVALPVSQAPQTQTQTRAQTQKLDMPHAPSKHMPPRLRKRSSDDEDDEDGRSEEVTLTSGDGVQMQVQHKRQRTSPEAGATNATATDGATVGAR